MMVEDIAVEVLNNFKDEELLDLSGLKEYNSISWTAELVYAVEDAMNEYYPDLEEPEEIDVRNKYWIKRIELEDKIYEIIDRENIVEQLRKNNNHH